MLSVQGLRSGAAAVRLAKPLPMLPVYPAFRASLGSASPLLSPWV